MRLFLRIVIISVLTMSLFSMASAQDKHRIFVPIGGGYGDTYDGFAALVLEHAESVAKITVLPITYATDAVSITAEELQENVDAAEGRRQGVEDACVAAAPEGVTCEVKLAPIYVRADAENPDNLEYFPDDLTAVYILGGDQTIAMQVVANTPIEEALAKAYAAGVIIGGTSAGLSVQNKPMIGGYIGEFGPETGLAENSVDLWNTDDKRGFSFGLKNVLLEQHFWERARISRLLNALVQPDMPHIGLGVDSYTAATITDENTITHIWGLYTATILDAETYSSAAKAEFKNGILSIHDVLFHQFGTGEFGYDLASRTNSIAALPESFDRNLDGLTVPEGAGSLLLSSLGEPSADDPVLKRFVELSGGDAAVVIVAAVGYASNDDAQAAVTAYGEALGVQTFGLIISAGAAIEIPPGASGYTGIAVISPDQAAIDTELLGQVVNAWKSGKPLLLNDAAAAVAGTFYSAQGPTPESTDDDPYADIDYIQGAFIQGNTEIKEGLALLPVTIEPRVMDDYRFGRLVTLAYEHQDTVAFGLGYGAGLEISAHGATVIGTNGVYTLDLRGAALAVGDNDAYAFANGLLDTFAPGETVAFD